MTMTDEERAELDGRVCAVGTRITRVDTLLYVFIAMQIPQFATMAHLHSMDGKR